MMSDLTKLKTFIRTLPKTKVIVDEWGERYIDGIDSYNEYDMIKTIALKRDRKVDIRDMIDGYSDNMFKSLCDDTDPNDPNQCHECCSPVSSVSSVSNNTESPAYEYDPKKCNKFFAKNVKNWSELCGYHILFLQGKTPGTPNHPGPWNNETSYIIEPLIRILSKGILTVDFQPGLLINGEQTNYIKNPYLSIGGPAGRIHRILIKLLRDSEFNNKSVTLDNSIIKFVPHPLRKLEFWGYENYEPDNQDYVSVMLGIEPDLLSPEIIEYILSNRFFERIANVVEITG